MLAKVKTGRVRERIPHAPGVAEDTLGTGLGVGDHATISGHRKCGSSEASADQVGVL